MAYIAWLMALEGLAIPAYAAWRWRGQTVARLRPYAGVGLLGAALSVAAYGLVLWAQTKAELAPIAALRESSVNRGSCSNNFAAQGHVAPSLGQPRRSNTALCRTGRAFASV
jgi:hypothetical protein